MADGTALPPSTSDADAVRPEAIRAVPVRHPGRWVSAALVGLVAAQLINWFVTSKGINLTLARHYVFDHAVLVGVGVTLELTAIAMGMGVVLGITLAVMRLSKKRLSSRGRHGSTSGSSAGPRCTWCSCYPVDCQRLRQSNPLSQRT